MFSLLKIGKSQRSRAATPKAASASTNENSYGLKRLFDEINYEHACLSAARDPNLQSSPEAHIAAWNKVCEVLPDAADGPEGLCYALSRHNRLDEAEAVIAAARRRWPGDGRLAVAEAQARVRRSTPAETDRIWSKLYDEFPLRIIGYIEGAKAARAVGDIARADGMLEAGCQKFPKYLEMIVAYARAAMEERRWETALDRWRLVKERFPSRPESFIGTLGALNALQRFDEADTFSLTATREFPLNPEVRAAHARTSAGRGDIAEARRRWQLVRDWCPSSPIGWLGEVNLLRWNRMTAELEAILRDGASRFPDIPEFQSANAALQPQTATITVPS